jgi:glycosyltransferase involved in cell wall biosynthesis
VTELSPIPDDRTSVAPQVSIGLPVFNGERYLSAAIASILDQDFRNLELIICDNASTDGTAAICAGFAQADQRVRYIRNPRNLGAARNYDLCFEQARGTYFKWAAHDDCLAPGYLTKAVAALDRTPAAVLCTVGVAEIGPQGEVLRRYTNRFPGIEAASPARRFGAVIHTRHQCEDFFGLFRRTALIGSELHGAYSGSDRVLLAEMALRGPWVSLPDPLFLHREHEDRYTRAVLLKDRRQAALWQDPGKALGVTSELFHAVVYWRYLRLVRKSVPSPAARAACYAELLRWWFTDDHLIDLMRDAMRRHPALQARLRTIKGRLWRSKAAPPPGSLPDFK